MKEGLQGRLANLYQEVKLRESAEKKTMSRAAKGNEKYGKKGMQALAKAGREGKNLDKVRDKYNKYDESVVNELGLKLFQPTSGVFGNGPDEYNDNANVKAMHAKYNDMIKDTKQELEKLDVRYSQLIMEMGRGTRVILNDVDPENPELPRAIGINLKRDEGLKDIEIPSYISPYESN
jgi:hypothetical protein